MARCLMPMTAAKNRAISSRLRTMGKRLGCLGQRMRAMTPFAVEGDLVEESQGSDGLVEDAP